MKVEIVRLYLILQRQMISTLALGSNFNSSSSSLEKLKQEFNGFDTSKPATTAASFDNDALISKQLHLGRNLVMAFSRMLRLPMVPF